MKMICSLNDDVFELVKKGTKKVEIRLNDEKRKTLKVDDTLVFLSRPDKKRKITTKVKKIDYYDTFEELVKNYELKDMYFESSSKEELLELLNSFYSKEEEEKYGALAITFEKTEKSCGVVVFKNNEVLLIKHVDGHIGMPKGHVEENETEEETAIREVKEETNIDVKITSDFRKVITYSPKLNTTKDVVYFIGDAITTNLKAQEEEVSELNFVDIKESISLITYDRDREVLIEAIKYKNL